MRDRLVLLYAVVVLAQLPFYFVEGRGPLGFDFSMKAVEKKIRGPVFDKEEQQRVRELLTESRGYLESMADESSRWALIEHEEGVLAWKSGDTKGAMDRLERARAIFKERHGPDSFHAHAVNLRIGELEFLRGEHDKALVRFQLSLPPVSAYLGARAPFPVRMKFRLVACLVSAGRLEEAAELTKESLSDLLSVASEQDTAFLQRTGSNLDILRMKGLLGDPPASHVGWTSLLLEEAKKESAPELGESS